MASPSSATKKKKVIDPNSVAAYFGLPFDETRYRSSANGQCSFMGFETSMFNYRKPHDFVGIEVEIEQVDEASSGNQIGPWAAKEDHSLRDGGVEFVSCPLPISLTGRALKYLFGSLENYYFGQRTSIHIHYNCSHFNFDQIKGIVMAYMPVERLLYKYIGGDRFKNIFCMPLYKTGLSDAIFESVTREGVARNQWQKYCGINILPLSTYGTLEFRHMGGTDNVEKLVTWINLLSCIIEYGSTMPLDHIKHEIVELNTNSNYHHFVTTMFGEYAQHLDLSNPQVDMEEPVSTLKGCVLNRTFHDSIRENISNQAPIAKFFGAQIEAYKPSNISSVNTRILSDWAAMDTPVNWGGLGAVVPPVRERVAEVVEPTASTVAEEWAQWERDHPQDFQDREEGN